MNAQELVAWNLRRIRVTRGVSQEALAVDAAIDRTYVSRLERCMENPTVNVLERLAQALETDITAFFEKPADDAVALPILPSGRKRQGS
ncbi:MAG: helix-turn-helix transcriptional regulator [Agitococcus sp.]|nr:helix-turn-helix transcriptional regulator [Agitococcus sp.]